MIKTLPKMGTGNLPQHNKGLHKFDFLRGPFAVSDT